MHRDFVGDAAQMGRHPIGQRRPDAVAHLDMIAMDGNPAVRVDFHRRERRSPRRSRNSWWRRRRRSRRVIPALGPRAFSWARCCQIGCFSSLSRISGVRTETLYGFPVMVRPPVLSALRRRNSIGSSGSAAATSSISTSSAVIVCSVP